MVAETAPIALLDAEFVPAWWSGCVSSIAAINVAPRSFKVAYNDTLTNVPETLA